MVAYTPCWKCRRRRASKNFKPYAVCDEHRGLARAYWHARVERRLREGCCISCSRRPVPGEQRCEVHKEINRLKCAAWGRRHPERSHKYWLKYKRRLAAAEVTS